MPLKTQHDEQPQLNLTPMIDVVFLLIVFFMVATKFTELERDIELQLPEVSQATTLTAKPEARQVVVLASGQILLDGEEVDAGQLTSQLAAAREEYPALSVVIRGAGDGLYQNVAEALAACKEARITNVNLSVKLASNASPPR